MKLTDTQCRNVKPTLKDQKLADGGGLFLLVKPSGSKLWRWSYRFQGKQKQLSFGSYPVVTLAEARSKLLTGKRVLEKGMDPSDQRKQHKEQAKEAEVEKLTFKQAALQWFNQKHMIEVVVSHAERNLRRLERLVFPDIGDKPVAEVLPKDITSILDQIVQRGHNETASRVKTLIAQVYDRLIATGEVNSNPARMVVNYIPATTKQHMASITEPKKLGQLLRSIYSYSGGLVVAAALKLAPMLPVRPGELRHAEWSEIDMEKGLWSIPAGKTKIREPLIVPLPEQAIAILKQLKKITGSSKWCFPSARDFKRPMSANTVNAGLRSLGYPKEVITGHGFRACFRTIADEVLHERPDLLEQQLGHSVRDAQGRAYNRTRFLEDRKALLQRWTNYLDELKSSDV